MAALWMSEKYSAAADLARVLFGGIASHTSPLILTKQGVRLVYTTGHAVQRAAPEVYDPAYKSWERQDVAEPVRNGFRVVPAEGKAAVVAIRARGSRPFNRRASRAAGSLPPPGPGRNWGSRFMRAAAFGLRT